MINRAILDRMWDYALDAIYSFDAQLSKNRFCQFFLFVLLKVTKAYNREKRSLEEENVKHFKQVLIYKILVTI